MKTKYTASQEKFMQICSENGLTCVPFGKNKVAVKTWKKANKATDTQENIYNRNEIPTELLYFQKVAFETQTYIFS